MGYKPMGYSLFTGARCRGQPRYFISQVMDVTDRKQAEEDLLESEQKSKAMAEALPLAISASSDIDQKASYINPAFDRLFGYTIDEVPTAAQWWPVDVSSNLSLGRDRVIKNLANPDYMEIVLDGKKGFKCIFMSGYTAQVIAHHGILDAGIDFLQKPFSVQSLAEKVRDVLDGGNGSPKAIFSGSHHSTSRVDFTA